MRIRGCSAGAIAVDPLWEVLFRASMASDARLDTGSGFDFGINTGCDLGLLSGLFKLNSGCCMLMGARFVAVGPVVATVAGESVCAPGMNALGASVPKGNATMASNVIHRIVKRVVGFSRGNSFRKSHIAIARNAPSQIPLRRVVIATLACVICVLLVRSP